MKLSLFSALLIASTLTRSARALRGSTPDSSVSSEISHRNLMKRKTPKASLIGSNRLTASVPPTCSFVPNSFESEIIVEFEGDPTLVTKKDIGTLQTVFVDTYTAATNSLCDTSFREMFTASVVEQGPLQNDGRRELATSSAYTPSTPAVTRRRFSYRFFVVGVCRACKRDSVFFDDGVRRRMQEQESIEYDFDEEYQRTLYNRASIARIKKIRFATNSAGYSIRRPQDRPEIYRSATFAPAPTPATLTSPRSCTCENPNSLNKAPSEDSYARRLNVNVQAASISGIDTVIGVTEVKEILCDAGLDAFTSTVLINGVGQPDQITANELKVLGTTFVSSYNNVAFETCDPTFRAAERAVFTVEPMDTADATGGGRQLFGRSRSFRFRVAITGVCKLCPREDVLFDDAIRRTLHEVSSYDVNIPAFMAPHRQLGFVVGNDTCFCAVNAPRRAPVISVFTQYFNNSVVELINNGTIVNLDIIDSAVQVNENLPSSTPTSTPTTSPAPSFSPSVRPTTAQPTRAPTNTPTPAPTRVPTTEPTDAPTPLPTVSPTLAPTSMPTRRPTTSQPTPMPFPTESPRPSPSPSLVPSS